MTTLTELKCPNCGAGLPTPDPTSDTTTCEYCQATIAIERDEAPKPTTNRLTIHVPAPRPAETPQTGELLKEVIARQAAANQSTGGKGCVVVLLIVGLLVGGLVTLIVFLKRNDVKKRRDMIAKNERESREREKARLLDDFDRRAKRFLQEREREAEDIDKATLKRIDALLTDKEYPIPFQGSAKAPYRIIDFAPLVDHYPVRRKALEKYRKKLMRKHPGLFRWYTIPLGHTFYYGSIEQVAAFEILKTRGEKAWWDYLHIFSRHAEVGVPRAFRYILRASGEPRDRKELMGHLNGLRKTFLRKIRRTGINGDAFIAAVLAKKHKEIVAKVRDLSVDLGITKMNSGALILKNHVWKVGHIYHRPAEIFGWIYPELNPKRKELEKHGIKTPALP